MVTFKRKNEKHNYMCSLRVIYIYIYIWNINPFFLLKFNYNNVGYIYIYIYIYGTLFITRNIFRK